MDNIHLAATLLQLTGNLVPVAGSTPEQLSQLRQALAQVLQSQLLSEILSPNSVDLQTIFSRKPFITSDAINTVSQIAGSLEPTPESPLSDLRVFRREVPVLTSQNAASVPQWAAGQMISSTLGPFADSLGRLYWFDFYRIRRQLKVARGNASAVFLSIPVRGLLMASNTYPLDAGSIWFISTLLASSAPAGSFTGLKIKRGTLSINGPVNISGDTLVIASNQSCMLELELDQPVASSALDTNTGDDAKQMTITLPRSVTLICNPGGMSLVQAEDMALTLYGQEYSLTSASHNGNYEPILNRLLIPFKSTPHTVHIARVLSQLFQPGGTAPLTLGAWALPVTLTSSIDHLGDAGGIGAICLVTDVGLSANWQGLEKGTVKLRKSYLMAEPGRIALTATQAFVRGGRQHFELWNDSNSNMIRQIRVQANISYPNQFEIRYNSLSSGNEIVTMMEVKSSFTIDRPLRADRQRPNVHSDRTELALLETKSVTQVYLLAWNILERLVINKLTSELNPISFALSNSLIKTTPFDDLVLVGVLENQHQFNKGALALAAHIYDLIPSLPDPYVSSYKTPFSNDYYQDKVRLTTGQLGYKSTSGVSLLTLIRWTAPDQPLMTFSFIETNPFNINTLANASRSSGSTLVGQPPQIIQLPAPNTTDTALLATDIETSVLSSMTYRMYAARIPQIEEVAREDQANTQKLRSYFDAVLNTAKEQIYMLDVSTNADLLGVGLDIFGRRRDQTKEAQSATASRIPFEIIGVDLSALAANTRLYTLPQIQWEAIRTIQNPKVKPYPFPSPATSPDTGDPALLGAEVYELIPIAPRPVVKKILAAYNDSDNAARVAGLFTLPFGMKAVALWDNAYDNTKPGALLSLNQPKFDTSNVEGGIQISVLATSPDVGDNFETAGFKGATIQTRNLIDLLTGTIPLDDNGKPLSVLGPVVDTIFNNEFKPGGANERVPVHRIDFSGYGATLFSNWLNPNAEIAATSQTRFDVWIGRTSHEIVQVKSILYPCGVPLVRTITIQRTSGGGVTRYDSGWKAQGPGIYDFSYYVVIAGIKTQLPNPFEFHPGVVKGLYNVTNIADTGRIYHKPGGVPTDDVTMQEVFFDADVLLEDVSLGARNGFVPSKKQRGFVQLAPYQRPLSPQQFYQLLQEEGNLGGPVDCMVNVGASGQPMRLTRIDVSGVDNSGAYLFVSAGRGSLQLPKEGSWSLVRRQESTADIVGIDVDGALPLIREGRLNTIPVQPYRFAEPSDIRQASSPASDYGILHSTGSQKVLYLRPTIARGDANIRSTLRPYFADSYAILGSTAIFPNVDSTFPLGLVGTTLAVIGPGQLRLTSGGTFTTPVGYQRDLLNKGGSRIYVDYSDVADSGGQAVVTYTFDSQAPVPWTAMVKKESIVIDIMAFKGLITVTSEFEAAFGQKPTMPKPKVKFGSILQPIVDLLKFLGDFDMSQAFSVNMGNATVTTWQPKWKASLIGFKLKYEAPAKLEIWVFGFKIKSVPQTPGVTKPPVKLELDIEIEGHYNMLPFSKSSDTPSTDLAKVATDMLSVGASLKLGGEIDIFCTSIGILDLYFVGILEFEFGIDSKEGKSFGFKVAVGLELATEWPVVGEVSVMMAVGLEMEWKDSGSGIYAIMIFKGEAELLGGIIVIGISIEAKGGTEKEIESGEEKTYAVCEVEFAAEVTLAFVIHFEFDVTWQEKKQV
ncbi:MAG: hypothetical protein HXX08_14530 [Chloroflexi bacterium]|uniref:Uncharacterized protein n=1 Tax=Candidatus Chlorohelix allophototropha TaxID=3003348 RepID=A0A8T7M4R1_9CHLR|nr:hypothetical protein [Chloroflexota bacterium]WJW70388.1 hypothetical protein OZ401_004963 [Chloroflexota bacterium L227-S17]